MLRLIMIAGVLSATGLLAAPQVEIEEEVPAPAQDTVASVKEEYDKANRAWSAKYRSAKDADARRALMKDRPQPDAYRKRVWAIVDRAPSEKAGGDGLVWIVGIHLVAGLGERATDREAALATAEDGFVEVCRAGEIPERRARVHILRRGATAPRRARLCGGPAASRAGRHPTRQRDDSGRQLTSGGDLRPGLAAVGGGPAIRSAITAPCGSLTMEKRPRLGKSTGLTWTSPPRSTTS